MFVLACVIDLWPIVHNFSWSAYWMIFMSSIMFDLNQIKPVLTSLISHRHKVWTLTLPCVLHLTLIFLKVDSLCLSLSLNSFPKFGENLLKTAKLDYDLNLWPTVLFSNTSGLLFGPSSVLAPDLAKTSDFDSLWPLPLTDFSHKWSPMFWVTYYIFPKFGVSQLKTVFFGLRPLLFDL